MLLRASKLQRPLAHKLVEHAPRTATNISRRICNDAFGPRYSWSCTSHRQCESAVSIRSRHVTHSIRIPSQTILRNSVRFSSSHDFLRNRAFIALGSNMGHREAMIEQACQEMEATGDVKILRTSSLYETEAMYVLDQDRFVNGACEVATSLSPLELLDFLQSVENRMGRVKVINKGPRNIDLDILLYVKQEKGAQNIVEWNDERLILPHKLMNEREFVLRPLHDVLQNDATALTYRNVQRPFQAYVGQRLKELRSNEPLSPLTPLGSGMSNITPHASNRFTRVMSILNMTPDSFSDGGNNYGTTEKVLKSTVLDHIACGATILDVGGQSTRPGSIQVGSEEELKRVLPAIKLIRSLELNNIAISVDTYRADVAEASVKVGAHIINDVSAGIMDTDMLPTAARLGCTLCLMHMRGTPETMNSLTSYPDGIVETVGRELLERVQAAEAAGIRRWRIILDPGIGFAKTQQQNLELLRRFDELRRYPGLENFPWLVGTSRKAFIGHITGVETAKERVWGTAVTVAAAVQGGADIVRVHDVREMAQVTKMADTIWRAQK